MSFREPVRESTSRVVRPVPKAQDVQMPQGKAAQSGPRPSPGEVMRMQRSIGNRAVGRLLGRAANPDGRIQRKITSANERDMEYFFGSRADALGYLASMGPEGAWREIHRFLKASTNKNAPSLEEIAAYYGVEVEAPPVEAKEAEEFGGEHDVEMVHDQKAKIRVILDSHQNKHQTTMIPELGTWKSKMGSTFASGKGLAWHRDHTAQTLVAWAKTLVLKDGDAVYLKKEPLPDGIIYDAMARMSAGTITVVYHCNPPKSE